MKTQPRIRITEAGTTIVEESEAQFTYIDHQPGDATRYEIAVVDVGGRLHLGELGYVSEDAMLVVSGMGGRAYLFRRGDVVAEWYVEEKFGLNNPHTIHHVTELIARAIGGSVVACDHEVEGEDGQLNEDRVLDLADDAPTTYEPDPRD